MEESPVTRAYLETLATHELIRMADTWGIDIPPDLHRIFIIEELLYAALLDEADLVSGEPAFSGEPEMADAGFKESVPLPRQYNITFLEVMIRDPLWAFVFWEIKASDKELYEKSQDFDGYYLKVSPRGRPVSDSGEDGVFTVPVKPDDSAWYLGLSSASGSGNVNTARNQYRVELCAGMKGNETVIVTSAPFYLPELYVSARTGEEAQRRISPLLRLSGYEDFSVVRSSERTLRSKRGAWAG